jgi:uncharacterized protein
LPSDNTGGAECRLRDGTVLRADVYRPVAGGDRPVLLHRSPYDKQIAQSDLAYPHPAWYAAHGYVVVAQDVRGRWRSDGDFYPFLHEADDGWDTVEWAARLAGCDGRVAMYGFSYAGATQLLAAAGRPPSLAAVCPALTASQFYEGWTYRGVRVQDRPRTRLDARAGGEQTAPPGVQLGLSTVGAQHEHRLAA